MDVLFFILLTLIMLTLIVVVPLGLSLIIYWFIKKRRWNKYLSLLSLIPIIIVGYFIYDAIFPSETFYKEEFKIATDIDFPCNGKFIFKSATYPDIHGSYSSIFCFESDSIFFQELQNKLGHIKDTTSLTPIAEFENGKERIKERALIKEFSYNKRNVYYSVGFFSDKRTILMHRVTY